MALELVGGALLSAFLQIAFQKLASPQILDFFLARELDQNLLRKLETKMHSINSLADEAERKQFTDPHVRNWLLKVKDIVLDAEDLLDDIQKLYTSHVDTESESQTCSGCTCKVLNFFKTSPNSSINKEIECRMEQILDNLEFLSSQKGDLGLKTTSGVGSGLSNELPQKSHTTSLVDGIDIYGRDDDKLLIFDWLTSDINNGNQPSILSLVGMGGVGKTTLAQHVFNDPKVDEAKFVVKAWVCVSDEFDVFKISRAILEALTKSTDDSRDLEMVHRRLKEELKGKKFLLVLDDVWNENQPKWEELRKPLVFGAQGSRILVTTRSKEVASIMRSKYHSLKQLQEDDCWKLFAKNAFRDDNTEPDPECRKIGMEIVKKCKGLPLALKTMGSMLYNKSSVSEWETVFQSEIWEFSKERCDIIPALALSYIHLPSHLKVCFSYCALLPKDYEFRKKGLTQLWMTENFPHFRQDSRTPEEVCQQFFNDLLSRFFFQPSVENKKLYVMHDLLNDLAKYIGGDIYIRCKVDEREKTQKVTRHFLVEIGHNEFFDGFGTLCNTKSLRTFIPKARSTMNSFWRWEMKMPIHELLSKFKFLRILSLSYCSDLQELPNSVSNLEHLRSLDLSCTAINRVTEKICLLSHLQILKLNYCRDLWELPLNLHLLTNLCRLEFKKTNVSKMPPHLGKLKNLKVVMNSFTTGHSRELGIQQLGELNLEGSLSIEELQNVENSLEALEADLKNKTHLVMLKLRWDEDQDSIDSKKEEDVIENLQPSKNLKKLSIFGYGGKQFPKWLLENSLLKMTSLVLDKCESCQCLPPLGLLPFLKVLKIINLNGIVNIDADFHGNNSSSFTSLKTLEFFSLSRWEKWDCQAVTDAFPRLRHLSIINCPKLKGQLPEQLIPLETLQIEGCQQLEASAPRALDLELSDCGKLQLEWGTMKSLTMTRSLLETVGSSDTLENLEINSPLESINDDCVSLRSFPLDMFPTLRTLGLRGFDNLEMISQSLVHNHLEDLTLSYCLKFESLPGSMHMLLPSLRSLCIQGCSRLESFPDGGFPSNLKVLRIINCSRLVSSLKGAFTNSSSLETLWITEPDAKCFPNEGLLPLSLTSLIISNCPNLEKLDYKGLHQLSSLQNLYLINCLNLQHLPEEGLPRSISKLRIRDCPLLEPRCQKEGDEDWEKIVHIQERNIS